jgi:hypothetical protein
MAAAPTAWDARRMQHARFAGVADLVARLADARDWPSVDSLNERFAEELARVGVRLVEAAKTRVVVGDDGVIDVSSLYEVRIVERGEIPTRPRNAHDLLNALVWAAFPATKLALTRALADVQRDRAAGRAKLPGTRSPDHDRLAMIDEGALVRVQDERTTTWIFGHAIYEHAYEGAFDVRGALIELAAPGVDALSLVAARAKVDHLLAEQDLARVTRSGPGVQVD